MLSSLAENIVLSREKRNVFSNFLDGIFTLAGRSVPLAACRFFRCCFSSRRSFPQALDGRGKGTFSFFDFNDRRVFFR